VESIKVDFVERHGPPRLKCNDKVPAVRLIGNDGDKLRRMNATLCQQADEVDIARRFVGHDSPSHRRNVKPKCKRHGSHDSPKN